MSDDDLSSIYGIPNVGITKVNKEIEKKKSNGVISKPGTEVVQLKTAMFDLMYCTSVKGNTILYGIATKVTGAVHKDIKAYTASGQPFIKLDHGVYNILLEVLRRANEKIKDQEKDISTLINERDCYKAMIDILKVNGIID